jgi:hypothetical protein
MRSCIADSNSLLLLTGDLRSRSHSQQGWGLYDIIKYHSHLQLREAGIFGRRKLIHWQDIASFSLTPDATLRFFMKTPPGKVYGCAVPPAESERIAPLLASKLPVLPTS